MVAVLCELLRNGGRIAENASGIDHNADRYTPQETALTRLLDDDRFPSTQVDRLELGFLASGEVTVRWRELGAEEYDGTVYPGDEST